MTFTCAAIGTPLREREKDSEQMARAQTPTLQLPPFCSLVTVRLLYSGCCNSKIIFRRNSTDQVYIQLYRYQFGFVSQQLTFEGRGNVEHGSKHRSHDRHFLYPHVAHSANRRRGISPRLFVPISSLLHTDSRSRSLGRVEFTSREVGEWRHKPVPKPQKHLTTTTALALRNKTIFLPQTFLLLFPLSPSLSVLPSCFCAFPSLDSLHIYPSTKMADKIIVVGGGCKLSLMTLGIGTGWRRRHTDSI